jgi:hypothetical protein
MSALRDYRQIWRVTSGQRHLRAGVLATNNLLALLAALAGVLVLATAHRPVSPMMVPRLLVGAGALWLTLVWTILFLPASMVMNSAANARLLPRQRRRLMDMAAAGWVLAAGGVGLALGDWFGGFMAGLLMLVFAATFCGNRRAGYLMAAAGNGVWLLPALLPEALIAACFTPAGKLAQTAALVAVAAFGLRQLYPAGGDAHMTQRVRQADFLAVFGMGHNTHMEDVATRSGWNFRSVYLGALRRDCRKADPGAMLLHVLGPAAHWSAQIAGAAVILAMSITARVALSFVNSEGARALLTGLPSLVIATLPLALALGTATVGPLMRRRAGEQALLRLAPLTGNTALLNRRLGARLLRGGLQTGVAMTAMIMAATAIVGLGNDVLLRQFALCIVSVQVALIGLPGDYAGPGAWTPGRVALAIVTVAAEGAIAAALGSWRGSPWVWLIALALLVTPFQVWRGWRAMLAAPVAFPAGRLR